MAPEPQRAIASIYVRDLHGKFTYTLDVAPRGRQRTRTETPTLASVTSDRLTLLYGTNGTGKTSLLRLLFHALSAAPDRHHRQALRAIRFREFKVTMTDHSYVQYTRDGRDDRGGYTGEVKLGRRKPVVQEFWPKTAAALNRRELEAAVLAGQRKGESAHHLEQQLAEYTQFALRFPGESPPEPLAEALAELGVNPVFLEDSRIITGDTLDTRRVTTARSRAEQAARGRRPDPDDELRRQREIDVAEALDRVRLYLSQLAFAGTQLGAVRVDN